MRRVDHDQSGALRHQAFELVQVESEARLGAQLPERHVAADGAGNAVELLIRRMDRDDVVSGLEQDVEQEEVGLDGARRDQDLLGPRVAVGRRDRRAQLECPRRLAVSQAQIEEAREDPFALLRRLEIEQLPH